MDKIYAPAEDSHFLANFVKKEITKSLCKNSEENAAKILDMGSGSGIQASTAIGSGANPSRITLVDKNPSVISFLKNKFPESRVIQSDLFSGLAKDEKFDLIIFNPPYLPSDKFDSEIDTTGGKHGSEIINSFLEQSRNHLEKNGKILLLTSSLTKGVNFKDYRKKLLGKKKLFFEELYVWELKE